MHADVLVIGAHTNRHAPPPSSAGKSMAQADMHKRNFSFGVVLPQCMQSRIIENVAEHYCCVFVCAKPAMVMHICAIAEKHHVAPECSNFTMYTAQVYQ